MKILKKHILSFTNGSASPQTKKGGYGYVIKNYHLSDLIPRSANQKTNHNKMEIQALIEVFEKIEPQKNPALIFVTSDYIYNCLIGRYRKKSNKTKWEKLDSLIKKFKNNGGSYKVYLFKSKLKDTKKDAKKAMKIFNKKNKKSNIKYLNKISKISKIELFKEIIRCFEFAHDDAVSGRKTCKI